MTDVFTPSLGLVKQSTGSNDQVWGDVLNDGMIGLCDDAIAGRTDIDVTAGNVSLSSTPGAADQARAMFLLISAGTPGATRDVIVPTLEKVYFVHNNVGDGSDVVFRTALGVGITVLDGTRTALWVDGVNGVVRELGLATGGGGSSVSPMGVGLATPGEHENNNGISGSFLPTVITNFQGSIGVIFIPVAQEPTFDVVINATNWRIVPRFPATTFGNTPTLEDMTWHMETRETLAAVRTVCVYYADGSAIEFFKADGTAWVFGSTRGLMLASTKPLMYGLTGT